MERYMFGFMNIFKSHPTPNIQKLIKIVDQPIPSNKLKEKIQSFLQNNGDLLIGELINGSQETRENWREIGRRLRKVDVEVFKDVQPAIGSIQKIATLLKNDDTEKLTQFTTLIHENKHSNFNFLVDNKSTVINFHSLKLPEDLKRIRSISQPDIRAHVLANLINRDKVSLGELFLTKNEMMEIAPYLTYVNYLLFDVSGVTAFINGSPFTYSSWKVYEIHKFLERCVNAETLIIRSREITKLPSLNKCREIDCSDCEKLSQWPESLPNCRHLKCRDCISTTQLPELFDCENVDATNCAALTSMKLFNCQRLESDGCVSLRTLTAQSPGLRLQKLKYATFSNCPLLDTSSIPPHIIAQLARLSNVIEMIAQNSGFFPIKVEELGKNPLQILMQLGELLLRGQEIPPIRFIEVDGRKAEGGDMGGLSRILMSRLLQELIDHSDDRNEQLSFTKGSLGAMPVLITEKGEVENQKQAFRTLGAIFGVCMRTKSVTGQLFDPALFRIISSCTFDDLHPLDVTNMDISDELRLKLLEVGWNDKVAINLQKQPNELTDDEFKELLITLENSGELEEKTDVPDLKQIPLPLETKHWIYEEVKKLSINTSKEFDMILPAVCIAKQMQIILGKALWKNWCENADELQENVEGITSKEIILSSIDWEEPIAGFFKSENIKKTKKFVEQWINESEDKDLRDFIFTLVGSPSLPKEQRLKFVLVNREANRLPFVHTCQFQIDLPMNYPDYETFKKIMEILIKQSTSKEHSGTEEK